MTETFVGELTLKGVRLRFFRRVFEDGIPFGLLVRIKRGWMRASFDLKPEQAEEIVRLIRLALYGARKEDK